MIIWIILLDYKSEIITVTGCPSPGFYGENCSIPCPHNCHCHIVEGTCLGCLPGYRGVTCNDGNENNNLLYKKNICYLQISMLKNQFSDLQLFKVHSINTKRITETRSKLISPFVMQLLTKQHNRLTTAFKYTVMIFQ